MMKGLFKIETDLIFCKMMIKKKKRIKREEKCFIAYRPLVHG
jgi:hypothetical protein